ncbi:alpha/beta hydrolase [Mesorhizobium australicum]|uniref:Acetyl esterase n=1 Tax=Mesorhizobium australicum TaxID=536018 RepID=A0A1X7N0U4_9HYPH|nr:alpha/beta hydrolase [Mesorhizobium australicum]SMH30896.1 acetyl esterase [Mesorhizobium australicum]
MPLHPFMIELLQKLAGRPALSAGTPEDGRLMVAAGRAGLGRGPGMHHVNDVTVPSRRRRTPGRLFYPSAIPDGLILYLHGGGWVLGALDDYDTYARTLAAETNFAVLLLDYALAPEHPFPAGLDDCVDAITACIDGTVPGMTVNRPLVVAGDSAGANLATVALGKVARRKEVALQVLYYPVTDCDFGTGSYAAHGKGLPLTGRDMRWFFKHYAPSNLWASPDISPLKSNNLADMPPAIIATAEYDVLCDEGEAYAQKLRDAGVPVTLRRLDGLAHGFVRLHNLFDAPMDELRKVAAEIRATRAPQHISGD